MPCSYTAAIGKGSTTQIWCSEIARRLARCTHAQRGVRVASTSFYLFLAGARHPHPALGSGRSSRFQILLVGAGQTRLPQVQMWCLASHEAAARLKRGCEGRGCVCTVAQAPLFLQHLQAPERHLLLWSILFSVHGCMLSGGCAASRPCHLHPPSSCDRGWGGCYHIHDDQHCSVLSRNLRLPEPGAEEARCRFRRPDCMTACCNPRPASQQPSSRRCLLSSHPPRLTSDGPFSSQHVAVGEGAHNGTRRTRRRRGASDQADAQHRLCGSKLPKQVDRLVQAEEGWFADQD